MLAGVEEEATAVAEMAVAAAVPAASAPATAPVDLPPPLEEYLDANAPEGLLCPISLQIMTEPVLLAGDGCTYSKAAIERHLDMCRARESGPLRMGKHGERFGR